ncbi:MAG: DUF1294 domain-containing protein [Proteobacteria bacterium]|nr:DUF1294 domain-containing protein [Pseudomonadota bacterium]
MIFLHSVKIRSFVLHCAIAGTMTLLLDTVLPLDTAYIWFMCLNIVTFFSFGMDKWAAKSGSRRTPELTYHLLGLVGGFPGIFAGRGVFNHKTSKLGFIIPMWLFFFAQLLGVAWFYGDLEGKIQRSSQKEKQQTEQVKKPAR